MNISIKNVPEEIVAKLKERAKRNHRSLQGELRHILEAAAKFEPRNLTHEEVQERIKELGLRAGTGHGTLTIEEAAKRIKELGIRTDSNSAKIIRELRDSS